MYSESVAMFCMYIEADQWEQDIDIGMELDIILHTFVWFICAEENNTNEYNGNSDWFDAYEYGMFFGICDCLWKKMDF